MRKIIITTKFIPAPAFSGGAIRNLQWIKFLQQYYDITLIGFWDKQYGDTRKAELYPYCCEIIGFPFKRTPISLIKTGLDALLHNDAMVIRQYCNEEAKEIIKQLIKNEKYEFVFCQELASIQFIPNDINIPVLLDDHNIEFELQERMASEAKYIKKVFFKVESNQVKKKEIMGWKKAKLTFFVSKRDECIASSLYPSINSLVVENSFPSDDIDLCKVEGWYDKPTCVFIGNLSWRPNANGLEHFFREIYPEVKAYIPKLTIIIIGSNPPRRIQEIVKHNQKDILLYKNIEEEKKRTIVSKCWLSIVPLYSGSGTRIKILELWAHSKAVLSTPIGAEGIVPSKGTILAKDDESFKKNMIELLMKKSTLFELGLANNTEYNNHYKEGIVYENSLYFTITSKLNEQSSQS